MTAPLYGDSGLLKLARMALEDSIQRSIDMLDALDARIAELEPDADDEIVSEDDGVVMHWWPCGVQK